MHACEHPRYGLTVHPNGTGEPPGTLFSTDRARTSWKVTPANSGEGTDLTSPANPSSACSPFPSTRCSSHLTPRVEHTFERKSIQCAPALARPACPRRKKLHSYGNH
ncbi:hypothetical protein GCM10009754_63950 [Amycolatopsis minnesotensis]|uniref:Uncharacterized protein n=1 Tax=Amycolatopsis minnesotensis TaxID=337894 RepID=A0ABP5DF23_9PSEU